MRRAQLAGAHLATIHNLANHPPPQRRRHFPPGEVFRAYPRRPFAAQNSVNALPGRRIDKRGILARVLGQLRQMFDNLFLELFREQRNELASDARARARNIAIGGIFAPALLSRSQISAQLGAANSKQRPHHAA